MAKQPKERKFTVTIWEAQNIWYWQLRGSNGRYLALCPADGYTSKRNAEKAVEAAQRGLTDGCFNTRVVPARKEAIAA